MKLKFDAIGANDAVSRRLAILHAWLSVTLQKRKRAFSKIQVRFAYFFFLGIFSFMHKE
jgi:hypothetical protein